MRDLFKSYKNRSRKIFFALRSKVTKNIQHANYRLLALNRCIWLDLYIHTCIYTWFNIQAIPTYLTIVNYNDYSVNL